MPQREYRIFLPEVKAPEMHLPSDVSLPNDSSPNGAKAQRPRSNLRAAGTDFFRVAGRA
jgi:hypothetical protein